MLQGKTVVVGVCGGIAAYKAVEVVSKLKKLKADVHVIMTKNATNFVSPLTFRSISHNRVITDMFDEPESFEIKHISLAEKADLILIAPASANIIGKISNGIADDMLTTTVMATKAPVFLVPSMNTNMYENRIVNENISRLAELGYLFIEPDVGMLACGISGKGRLPEPEHIVSAACGIINPIKDMEGVKILITAGPTREALDPVRYITNHSSGKMGYAVAREAARRGAAVKLVSGPVTLEKPDKVEIINVVTAKEMHKAVLDNYKDCNVLVMAAAVADYRSTRISEKKIKKTGDNLVLELVKNPDIAKDMGKLKGDRIMVGFSAETDNLINNAKSKLESKNFDMIVANDVTKEGAGFNTDTNIVTFIKKDYSMRELPIMSKEAVAGEMLNEIMGIMNSR